MKAHAPKLKIKLSAFFILVFLTGSITASAELTNKERNILANEAKAIDLEKVLITDNSWNKFPDYKDRQFWQSLPAIIRQEYITKAENYLDYNWPGVKATDYLEFIRSGDRRQEVYSACSNALISLVMGELVEGKGRFMDQIINAESHNHNDVGSFVMYYNGKPCIIDLGREEYNAKTFSSKRYEIWTMQSGYHNLPVINGTEQKDGPDFKAKNSTFSSNAKSVKFSTDIAGAYPKEARVKSWVRSYVLNRGKSFTLKDKYELNSISKLSTCTNLITYCKVSEIKPGLLKFEGDGFNLNMSFNPKVLTPIIEFIEVTDKSLRRYWPKGVTRIKLEFINPGLKGEQTLIFTPIV